ncbi:MAG: hypothetical protein LUE27_05615 [Clostridia bacterium]|nr:hypothetical protein [Clostridia bacterium]
MQISNFVTSEAFIRWIVIACFVAYFIYKEWPEFKRRVSSGAKKELEDEGLEKRVEKLEERLDGVDEKLARDYGNLNELTLMVRGDRKRLDAEEEAREIIMKSLLAIIEALQAQGANGPTHAAKQELMDYLVKNSHKAET